MFFEKSDLFFICMMRPLSFDIQKQDLEIEAAQVILGWQCTWMIFFFFMISDLKVWNFLKIGFTDVSRQQNVLTL